ncbi:predicted protein [Naegleria gruberi]|uniref:Predicted protein n=1 Tax=Naegleria gruberi TaxID=5762 RepID=D2VAF5_NAEGR|nr:uncharacterized protein NAEGRDRAFT_65841 [Naegleria gruberi]EFC46419.1 predicted protein [Naegleria gruberi]|eukprot:XP_002679163.1 predicted protein [Naegleria gruberi strain NEG-M]
MPTLVSTPMNNQAVQSGPQITSFQEVELSNQTFADYQLYVTHDNGGRAFVIQVRNDKQHIYIYEASFTKQSRDQTSVNMVEQEIILSNGDKITRKGLYLKEFNQREAYFFALIKELDANETPFEVFPGIDNTAEVFPSNAYPILFHGAALLIRFIPSNECWFFGIHVGKFTMDEPIQALYSPIGNNDVVYAYMFTDSKCYIFEEEVYSIDKQILNNRAPGEDIHDFFYSHTDQWSHAPYSFLSERITDKNYYDNPTTPLTQL